VVLGLWLSSSGLAWAATPQLGDELESGDVLEDGVVGNQFNSKPEGSCCDPPVCLMGLLGEAVPGSLAAHS